MDIDALRGWIGREHCATAWLAPAPVAALWATLDHAQPAPAAGSPLPPLYHWLYFLPEARQSELGADGHPARGGFLPPVPLPRRMWAASRIRYLHPLPIGATVSRRAWVEDVRFRQGRSGPLVFVTVRHALADGEGRICIEEAQDIVYRDSAPGATASALNSPELALPASYRRRVLPDPVLLFRYSALTFNAHRIHYDREYARAVEGYPALVVQGPLLATLLADALPDLAPGRPVGALTVRAEHAVLADGDALTVCGVSEDARTRLWIERCDGVRAMEVVAHHQTPIE